MSPVSRPPLRLFAPADLPTATGGCLSPAMSLAEFFAAHVLPVHLVGEGAARRNIEQYRESVGLWARLTGDPPLREITDGTCAEFLRQLRLRTNRQGEPISPTTLCKHRVPIQRILDLAGPKSRDNRRAAAPKGLFGPDEDGRPREAPLLPRPKGRLRSPDGGWTLPEIGLWLAAAERLEGPAIAGLAPAVFWRWLIVFLFNTALRIGTALAARRDMIAGGWLTVPAELMKGRRRQHRLWLNRHAREAVERLRTADARIVPWPHQIESIRPHVRRLRDATGIPEARCQAIDKPLHALRARCLTILWGLNPGVAKMVAGHLGGDVTLCHYVGASAMRRELERLPQPKIARNADRAKDQRLLFGDL